MTDTNRYKTLADLIAQQKALDEQVSTLKQEIIADLLDRDGEKLETPFATFSLQYRKSFEYSPELTLKIQQVTDKIKFMKKAEEKSGKATQKAFSSFVRVQLVKRR